jgi:hypothetical protein
MFNNLLKLFIIGFLFSVVFFFLIAVNFIKKKNYDYFNYSISCPIFFGITNILSYYIFNYLNITMRLRFIITSIITYFISLSFVIYSNSYNFNEKEWRYYMIILFMGHFITWNIIIYNIEMLFK